MKLRLVTTKTPDDALVGAYEEALFTLIKDGRSPSTVWLWKHPRVLYLLKNASVLYADTEYAKRMGYVITRSSIFLAKPTSIVVAGNDWGILTFINKGDFGITEDRDLLNKFYVKLWSDISLKLFNLSLENKGNDLVVSGTDRKILGMVSVAEGNVLGGHCMFSETQPMDVDLDVLYKLPARKFEGKSVSAPSERVTSVERETGKPVHEQDLLNEVIKVFNGMGIEPYLDELTREELGLMHSMEAEHRSEEFLRYGRIENRPDFE